MIINGINIKNKYSAILLDGSLNDVLEYPKLKKPETNDWAEEDGLEVDLVSPVLDKKNINISFLINELEIEEFVEFLLSTTYKDYYFTELGVSVNLRFLEIKGIHKEQEKFRIDIKLVDDKPLNGYSYEDPKLEAVSANLEMDGMDLSKYGISVLEGSENNLEEIVKAKKKLLITSKYISGVEVSEEVSKKQAKKAKLNLFIKQNKADFLKGYKSFLYDLVKPDERTLLFNGKTYKAYYSDSKIKDLIIENGFVWCNFIVSIIVISSEYIGSYISFEKMAQDLSYDLNSWSDFYDMAEFNGYEVL